MTTSEKLEALHKEAQSHAVGPSWVIYQFEDTASTIAQVFEALGTVCQQADSPTTASKPGVVYLLPAASFTPNLGPHKGNTPLALVAEHYPLPVRDQELLAALAAHLPNEKLTLFTAMDEPLLDQFGSERITALMQKMGINRGEAVSHSMVSKSIVRAQQKIAEAVQTEVACSSQQQWFERNYPGSTE